MKIMKSIGNAVKPLVLLALIATVGFAHAQQKSIQERLANPEINKAVTKGKVKPFVASSKVDPRSFFPRIVQSTGVKPIKPENPSRYEPISGIEPITQSQNDVFTNRMGSGFSTSGVRGRSGFGVGESGSLGGSPGGAKLPDAVVFGDNIEDFASPPDTHMAVSPEFMVQVINVKVGFYKINRAADGRPLSTTKLFENSLTSNGFVQGVGPTPFAFDPRVIFDKKSNRFYILVLDADFDNEKSSILLGVSSGPNPMDPWTWHRIDTTFFDEANDFDPYWLDYPAMGFNNDYLVMSGNHFPFDTASLSPFTSFYVVDIPALTAGVPSGTVTFPFHDFNVFNARPARTQGSGAGPAYSINWFGGATNANNTLSGYRLFATFKQAGFPIMTSTDVILSGEYYYGTVGAAPGANQGFDTISGRLMDASFSDGILATCQTLATSRTDPRAAARFVEFDMNNWPLSANQPTVRHFGAVTDVAPLESYQPAIERNQRGDVSMIFTRSSRFTVPTVMVATRKKEDPLGSFNTPEVLFQGPSYISPFSFTRRWGDYAGIQVDPTNDSRFFGFNHTAPDPFTDATVSGSWSIPAGFTQNNEVPVSVATIFGTNTKGNVNSFKAVGDNDLYEITAELVDGRGFYAAWELTFNTVAEKSEVQRLRFSMNGLTAPKSLPGYMYLLNADTGNWDLIRTFRASTTGANVEFLVPAGAQKYASADKKVKVRVLVFDPVRRRGVVPVGGVFFKTDEAKMNVNPPN